MFVDLSASINSIGHWLLQVILGDNPISDGASYCLDTHKHTYIYNRVVLISYPDGLYSCYKRGTWW